MADEVNEDFNQVLENFKKNHSYLAEYISFMQQLRKESERGVVLISMGFIEQRLEEILRAFFIDKKLPKKETAAGNLTDGYNAPLGTPNARILACFALGLITEDEYHDLNIFRDLRNKFAHKIYVSFETKKIAELCEKLKIKIPDEYSDESGKFGTLPRDRFLESAMGLIIRLINRPHYVNKEQRVLKEWGLEPST